MGNGHRPGREDRKPPGWMTPGERKRKEAAEREAKAAGTQPIEKSLMCQRCRGTKFVQHDENFKRCVNCGKKVFVRNGVKES